MKMSWNVIAIATSLGLTLVACGKKDAPKPPVAQKTPPAEKPAEAPTDKPAEAPTEKPAEAPTEKPAEAPTEKPDEAPTEKPDEAPTEKPAEAPTEKPAEAPMADRTKIVSDAMSAFSRGMIDEAFAQYTDDAVWAIPGMPEATGKAAIIENMKKNRVAFPDMKVVASRVFDGGENIVAIYTLTGTNTGAMGEGEPATGKAVGVEGAQIFHFNAEGKIDRVTDYFDVATMLMQLGVIPTPEGAPAPTLATLPETTEIVKGAANEQNLATTNAIMAAMTAGAFEAKMREVLAADFTMKDPSTGQIITGVDAVVTNMKEGMFKMWPDYTATVQQTWSIGDWTISTVQNKGTYKGGIPGVEAKDQATHFLSLDFTQYEGGKSKTYMSFANGMEVMAALGMGPGAAPAPEGGAAPAPEGGAAPAPEGGAAPAPEGGAAPAPEGGAAPSEDEK